MLRRIGSIILIITAVVFVSGCTLLTPSTDEQILNYFWHSKITVPNMATQEVVLEGIFGLDYDIIFEDIGEVWGPDYEDSIGLHITYMDESTEIWVDISVDKVTFGYVYAHELTHGLGYTDESMTNYMAFITMWESEIPYLRYQTYKGISHMFRQPDEYDCRDKLLVYIRSN